jgi:uncharacterized small protein (DUF1192 family)
MYRLMDDASEIERLRDELAEESALREKLAALLKGVAVALRGPEHPGVMYSFHDLPDRAALLRAERTELQRRVERWNAGDNSIGCRYQVEWLRAERDRLQQRLEGK